MPSVWPRDRRISAGDQAALEAEADIELLSTASAHYRDPLRRRSHSRHAVPPHLPPKLLVHAQSHSVFAARSNSVSSYRSGGSSESSASRWTNGTCVIMHNSKFRSWWDMLIILCLIYIAILVPPTMAFLADQHTVPVFGYIDVFQDCVFLVDILINCLTSFPNSDGHNVTSNWAILVHYLSTWFVLDAISSVPFSFFPADAATETKFTRIVRVLKLLKMIRMTKIARMIPKLQERFQIRNSTLDMIKFLVSITMAAHWLGCFYFIVSRLEGFEEGSWTRTFEGGILERPPAEQYLIVIYWALTTMTTIGYGDITPGTNGERVYGLFAMWVGAGIFAYALTNVVTLVFNMNQEKVMFERLLDKITEVMDKKKITASLKKRISQYMFYRFLNSHGDLFDATNEVLKYLSPSLKGEVMVEITSSLFEACPNLNQFGAHFMQRCSKNLEITSVCPGELLMRQGTPFFHTYYIAAGIVEVLTVENSHPVGLRSSVTLALEPRAQAKKPLRVKQWLLTTDCMFGEISSLLGAPSKIGVFSITHADIYMLDAKMLYEQLVDEFSLNDARAVWVEANKKSQQLDFTREARKILRWIGGVPQPDNDSAQSQVEKAGAGQDDVDGLLLTLPADNQQARIIRAGVRALHGLQQKTQPEALLFESRAEKLIRMLFGAERHAEMWEHENQNELHPDLRSQSRCSKNSPNSDSNGESEQKKKEKRDIEPSEKMADKDMSVKEINGSRLKVKDTRERAASEFSRRHSLSRVRSTHENASTANPERLNYLDSFRERTESSTSRMTGVSANLGMLGGMRMGASSSETHPVLRARVDKMELALHRCLNLFEENRRDMANIKKSLEKIQACVG